MDNITIRKMENSDAEEIIELKNETWRSSYRHIFENEVFKDLDNEKPRRIARFKQKDLNKNGHIGFVAVDQNKVVGFSEAFSTSLYEHYKELGYADLATMYILPQYQHIGLGRALFNKITKGLIELGHTKMVIGALKDNVQARSAYEKWGAVLDTSYEKPFIWRNKEYPEVFYLVNLNQPT